MQIYKINPQIIKLIKKAVELRNTTLILQHSEGNIEIPDVKIRHGIFPGDSLSPLLFYLTLDPLSNLINKQGHRYTITTNRRTSKETGKVTHLLYMDYLKLFAPIDKKVTEQEKLVKRFSEDIEMEFGLDKCAKCTFVEDKPTITDNIKIDLETTKQQLENEASHKYLGV